jgi:acetate CoA/acetoacetate CoA-transferase beta subunit
MSEKRDVIVKRVARMFKDGDIVNLGIGIPNHIPEFLPEGVNVMCQTENGFVGMGAPAAEWQADKDLINNSGDRVTIVPGGSCFDSSMSFTIIRGGHLGTTVLGAMQVDEKGNLANWLVPGKMAVGMGGAMDLVVGARRVIIAMEHTTKDGGPKILKRCTLPLTAINCVDFIVTDLCMMEYAPEGLTLRELAPGVSVADIKAKTEASFIVPDKIGSMAVD